MALRRLWAYFTREKGLVGGMLAVVALGTACGVWAPSLQSRAIDVIAGARPGPLAPVLLWMLTSYFLYSASQLVQGRIGARLSQSIVKRMREELFGKACRCPDYSRAQRQRKLPRNGTQLCHVSHPELWQLAGVAAGKV